MSQIQVNQINDASGGVLAPISSVMRNRIINGAMIVAQRGTAAVTTVGSLPVDRFFITGTGSFSAQQSSVVPTGFINSVVYTQTTAATIGASNQVRIGQTIEGFNISDLDWGTANAKTVTLSFWVRSSVTGSYGIGLVNNANDRSYVASYTITVANTWEYKTITVVGDTTGTWLTDNGAGIKVRIDLGSGSNFQGTDGAWQAGEKQTFVGAASIGTTTGANFYITGFQLEVGTQATSFEYRQYQQELALCQRYYYKLQASASGYLFGTGFNSSTTVARAYIPFPVNFRTEATALEQSGTAADYQVFHGASTQTACSAVPAFSSATLNAGAVNFTVASGLTAGQGSFIRSNSANGYLAFSAEL